MTNKEIQSIVMRAEDEYEMLKDRVHDLYDENKELKQKVERLNNNWNELEKWLNIQQNISSPEQILNDIFSKLQELKGDDK